MSTLTHPAQLPRFVRFILVGLIGFAVDFGTLATLMETGVDAPIARLGSMFLAALCTWRLNRSLTFEPSSTSQSSEGLRYLIVVVSAFAVNYAVFVGLILSFPQIPAVLAVAIATGTSMWVSYFGFALLAFQMKPVVYTGGTTAEPYTGVEELEILADAENYNTALANFVREEATPCDRALDFGAGIGSFSRRLKPHVKELVCLEPDAHLNGVLRESGMNAVSSSSEISDGTIDYVFTLNVLEHIEDDVTALKDIHRMLKPGGRLTVYVPALQYLYTGMDRCVGHWRRYSKNELIEKVRAAGFEIKQTRYADSLGVLATLVFKVINDGSGTPSKKSVDLYDRWAFPISHFIDRLFGGLYGKNLALYAYKPEKADQI